MTGHQLPASYWAAQIRADLRRRREGECVSPEPDETETEPAGGNRMTKASKL